MSIKRLLKRGLRHFGIVAFKRSSNVYVPEDESYLIVSRLVGRVDPVVIDGGAHLGDMVEKFGALLPEAVFHCFEPDPVLAEALGRKFAGSPRVNVVQAALGDAAGKAKFNINISRPCNSLLPSAAESLKAELKPLFQLVEQVEVDVTTIDEYCRENSIKRVDAIKLDLQGYDFFALRGATATLQQAKVVIAEVWFKEVYKGSHCFPDILNLMLDQGFRLHTLCGLHYGEVDELLWADAIFVKQSHTAT